MLVRNVNNPLITPAHVQPSRPDFEVIGTFNAGVTTFNYETLLLLRVAERPITDNNNMIACPHLNDAGELTILNVRRDDADYDTSDPRKVEHHRTGELFLTSISHLRLARSTDGVHFSVDDKAWLSPQPPFENFGTEDARITQIDDTYYVNYTAVSRYGVATALVKTRDFVTIEREGIIFPPANRDVAIFPQKVNGLYTCYHRPMPGMFGGYHMWMATSPDLKHWGGHEVVWEAKPNGWEGGRVGGGAPSVLTEQGWLSIYHAADRNDCYCLGAFLTATDQPEHVLAYSPTPILSPEAAYETQGFFPKAVFSCGAIVHGDTLRVYYGAADDKIALAEIGVSDLLNQMTWHQ